jgi:hypothetical protein
MSATNIRRDAFAARIARAGGVVVVSRPCSLDCGTRQGRQSERLLAPRQAAPRPMHHELSGECRPRAQRLSPRRAVVAVRPSRARIADGSQSDPGAAGPPARARVHCHAGCSRDEFLANLHRLGLFADEIEFRPSSVPVRADRDNYAARRVVSLKAGESGSYWRPSPPRIFNDGCSHARTRRDKGDVIRLVGAASEVTQRYIARARYGGAQTAPAHAAEPPDRGLWAGMGAVDQHRSRGRCLPARATARQRVGAHWACAMGSGDAQLGRAAASVDGRRRRQRQWQEPRRRLSDARRAAPRSSGAWSDFPDSLRDWRAAAELQRAAEESWKAEVRTLKRASKIPPLPPPALPTNEPESHGWGSTM